MHTFFRPIQIRAEVQYAMMILVRKSHTIFIYDADFFFFLSPSVSPPLSLSFCHFLALCVSISLRPLLLMLLLVIFICALPHYASLTSICDCFDNFLCYFRPAGEIKMHRPDRMDLCEQAENFRFFQIHET